MLVFATDFPVKDSMTPHEFLKAIQTWLLGSCHNNWREEDFKNIFVTSEVKDIGKSGQRLKLIQCFSEAEKAIAVKYTESDTENNNWSANIVFNQTNLDTWLGVRIFRESRVLSTCRPKFETPTLIKILLENFGGAPDGQLATSTEPIWLQEHDIELAARLISGQSKHHLPIVYVSVGFQGQHTLDSDNDIPKLAAKLSGMAHILIEPSRSFSGRLRNEADSQNVYGGTVGIYWSGGDRYRSFFLGEQFQSPQAICEAVYEEVRGELISRSPLERCTWSHTQKMQSRRRQETLKSPQSPEVNPYIDESERELEELRHQLRDAEREIKQLKSEIRAYESDLQGSGRVTFRIGNEIELYDNEIFEIVRDAASDTLDKLNNLDPQKYIRRVHVLKSFVDANFDVKTGPSSEREKLKAVLKGYTKMDNKTRKGLLDLGFSVSEDGKHCKLTFKEDDRYTFSIPKTTSDHRAGLNAASTLGNMFF